MNLARYFKDIVTLTLDQSKCSGCALCTIVCPHHVFSMNEAGKAQIIAKDSCMECGACARNCASAAIFVKANVGCAAAYIHKIKPNAPGNGDCCCEWKD